MIEDKNSRSPEAREIADEQTDTSDVPLRQQLQHSVDAEVTRKLAAMSPRQRRKQLRAYRKQARREKWSLYRDNWIEQQVDRPLPDTVESKLPSWVHSDGGRWTIIGLGVIAVLFWTLLIVLLIM